MLVEELRVGFHEGPERDEGQLGTEGACLQQADVISEGGHAHDYDHGILHEVRQQESQGRPVLQVVRDDQVQHEGAQDVACQKEAARLESNKGRQRNPRKDLGMWRQKKDASQATCAHRRHRGHEGQGVQLTACTGQEDALQYDLRGLCKVARQLDKEPCQREVHLAMNRQGGGHHDTDQDQRHAYPELLQAQHQREHEDNDHVALLHHLEEGNIRVLVRRVAEDQRGREQEPDRQNPSREEVGADVDLLVRVGQRREEGWVREQEEGAQD
mmetsp:Transcript_44112/g.103068  ORF Transcript_44112/g.103068 Transcript_44112/m.103068 type:complete len:271 (-) Transcript_44112:321-1133(-)